MKKSLPYDAYETLADSYASLIDTKPHNAYYERPATRSLVGNVAGQRILDAGCGPGVNTEWLVQQGASVVGIDASERMLAHARRRVGDKAEFYQANLEEPLDFLPRESFDGILTALTITYIEDHQALFTEFNRLLRHNGWLVFSTEHPFFSYQWNHIENYFEAKQVSCEWSGFGQKIEMPSYYHSLGSITEALSRSGFLIERILEPKPTEAFKEWDPKNYEKLMRFPLFICFRAKKVR